MRKNDITSRCPITGYPITSLSGWSNKKVDNYTYSFSKIGDSMIFAANSGDAKYFKVDTHYQLLESFARQSGIVYPMVEIRDTKHLTGKPTSEQIVKQKYYFIEHQDEFAGFVMCNVPFWLRAVVLAGLKRYKTTIEFTVCKTVEEALSQSKLILEKVPLSSENKSGNIRFDMLEFSDQWQFEDKIRQVFYRNGVIPGRVFYSCIQADYLSMSDFNRLSPVLEQVYQDGFYNGSKYIHIVDYSQVKKTSIKLRKAYIQLQIRLNKKYHCEPVVTYICGANLFVKISLKVFSSFVKQNFVFFDTIDQVFEDINFQSRNKGDESIVRVSEKDIEEINNGCGMLVWDEEEAQKGGAFHVSEDNPLHQIYETISLVQDDLIDLRQREIAQAAKLKKALKDAEAANQAKIDFLANMSHELRTPLNGVVGMLDLVSDTHLSPEQEDCINTAKSSADKLRILVNDIFEFMKLGEDTPVLKNKAFHLGELIETITRSMAQDVKTKNIAYGVSIEKDVPKRLIGDSVCLLKILHHLIGNAVKFAENGSVEVCVSKHDEIDDTVCLLFEILDTGIGIPEDKQNSLFELFSQADTSTTRKYDGVGIGLPITKKLVDLSNGELGFDSREGTGSWFWFKIEYKKQYSLKQSDTIPGNKFSNTSKKTKQILVVDDNRVNQKVVGTFLKKMGHDVLFADNGKQAVDMYIPGKYGLILMDLQMPVMDGEEAVKNIRSIESKSKFDIHTPIIALTANTTKDSKKRCRDIGMDAYMSKPVKKDALAQTIQLFIN